MYFYLQIVHRALCTFDLIPVKNLLNKHLDTENRQKVSLAKTAIGNPKIVILENPMM